MPQTDSASKTIVTIPPQTDPNEADNKEAEIEIPVPTKETKETKNEDKKTIEADKGNTNNLNKRKTEFSKILCVIAVVIFTVVAIFTICDYYALMRLAIQKNATVTVDASLPITCVSCILAAVLSYCLYVGMLKNSLNKNQLKIEDGIIKPVIENIVKDDDNEIKG